MATATLNSDMKTILGHPADLNVHYEGKGCDKAHSPRTKAEALPRNVLTRGSKSRSQEPEGGDHAKRDQLPRATQIPADFELG
jgi:hypothetical protein